MKPDINTIFKGHFTDNLGNYLDQVKPETIQTIIDHRLFKCFLPKTYGGLGLTMIETLEVIEACSCQNGSLGWLIQIGNGGMYFASCFEPKRSIELFSPSNAVIAGSGAPSGFGTRTDHGYYITGNWNYCSGSDYATLFTVTFQDKETGSIHAAIMQREKVIISKTWKAIGLKNTSTDTIRLESVYVPDEDVFNVTEKNCLQDHPIFNVPFNLFAQSFFLHSAFGIFERLLTEAGNMTDRKFAHWSIYFPNRLDLIKKVLQEQHDQLGSFRSFIRELLKDGYLKDNGYNPRELNNIGRTLRNSAHEIFGLLGMEVLDSRHIIAICYQDILATTQHYLLLDH